MPETKVPNAELLQAGLELMRQTGKPLERQKTKGRAMIYTTPEAQTVRVRTCNDHVLITVANSAEEGAALNIEGTDYLLILMPETPRTRGPIVGYLVPTEAAVQAARATHKEWLASNPRTSGHNRTWNIWFDDTEPAQLGGYGRKWARYRVLGSLDIRPPARSQSIPKTNGPIKLGEVIANAKRAIAAVAGVPESSVRITIDLA
jgi:hypothetical protein